MAYVQQALSKTKPATNINDVEEHQHKNWDSEKTFVLFVY